MKDSSERRGKRVKQKEHMGTSENLEKSCVSKISRGNHKEHRQENRNSHKTKIIVFSASCTLLSGNVE